jgi:hypothetical protein
MPIRVVDSIGRLGKIDASLTLTTSLTGTHVAPAARSGVLTAAISTLSGDMQGVFSAAPNRTGVIGAPVATLGALIQGATTAPADTTAPTQPSITATTVSSASISIALTTPSTDIGGSGLASYTLQRATDSAFTANLVTTNGITAGQFPYVVTGLAASKQYFFRLRPVDVAGNVGNFSSVVNATTQGAGTGIANGAVFTVTTADIVSGSGDFGTNGMPTVWDPCTGATGTVDGQWSGAWPSGYAGADAQYNMKLRDAGFRSIAAPHVNVQKFYGGGHYQQGNADVGCVMLWKNYQRVAGDYTYMTTWQRFDPLWKFGANAANGNGGTNDNNTKIYDHSTGTSPYDTSQPPVLSKNNVYLQFTANASMQADGYNQASGNDDSSFQCLQGPADANGKRINDGWVDFGGLGLSPWTGWRKWEIEIKWSSVNGGGWIKWWMNNQLVLAYAGSTDKFTGTQRNESIGGYARNRDPNNFRYTGPTGMVRGGPPSRFVFTDNANYNASRLIAFQPPKVWTPGSADLECNKEDLGLTPHLHFKCPVNGDKYFGTRQLV